MSNSVTLPSADPRKIEANSDRMPSLDGLRALSIVLVLLGHLSGTHGFVALNLGIGDYAHLGVVVFFVISGFLITRLLISEHAKKGHVSLKLFYARRTLRLFPASYAYLACVSVLSLMGLIQLTTGSLVYAFTYTVNYLPHVSWEVGHLWSLSVEEQFYLVWPITFVVLGARRSIWAPVLMIAFGPVARAAAWYFLRETPYRDLSLFPVVADSLAIGCVMARLQGWLEGQSWYLQLFRPVYSGFLLAIILVINRYMAYTVVAIFGASIINLGIAVLVHRSVYESRDLLGRILNWTPLAFIGVLSYSLYLWQQLFLNRHSTAWVNAFPQNIIFAITAALASYFLLEKPLLRLRHRLRA